MHFMHKIIHIPKSTINIKNIKDGDPHKHTIKIKFENTDEKYKFDLSIILTNESNIESVKELLMETFSENVEEENKIFSIKTNKTPEEINKTLLEFFTKLRSDGITHCTTLHPGNSYIKAEYKDPSYFKDKNQDSILLKIFTISLYMIVFGAAFYLLKNDLTLEQITNKNDLEIW
jgi:hypothetical protein